jgi:hypothetical protein
MAGTAGTIPNDIHAIRQRTIRLPELIPHLRPGDIGLSRSSNFLGRCIRFGQRLEEPGEDAPFSHAFVMAMADGQGDFRTDGSVLESSVRIGYGHLRRFLGQPLLLLRHTRMTPKGYWGGLKALENNIGQLYPVPRLMAHGVDMLRCAAWRRVAGCPAPWRWSELGFTDWPVCSELVGQFVLGGGLPGGWELGEHWKGLTPDHIFDAANAHPELYRPLFCGTLH